jgi:hypothetical protein
MDVAAIQMYADAMALNPSHAVHDFSGILITPQSTSMPIPSM